MHSQTLLDYTNLSNTDGEKDTSKQSSEDFTKKKRKRPSGTKNKNMSRKYSKKEEEKILKYALKLSEKEYQNKKILEEISKNNISFEMIEPVKEVQATEEDFKDIVKFLDGLWNENESNTGIIKIKAPESWKEKQKNEMENIFIPRFNDSVKKIPTRKQILTDLYKAKVIN
jgi:hypothetical protein